MAGASDQPDVRRKILAMLAGFSLVSYLSRMNISIAQQYMKPELGLSEIQIGQIFSAFMWGYALFQVPAGIWGDRRGPRLVLTGAALSWGFATILTGLVPGMLIRGATAAFLSLLVLRFSLGVGEAATYPVAALTIANWMPVQDHAFSNAVVIAGATVGSAFTPPLVAYLMKTLGWRESFYLTSVFSFAIALIWWWQARDKPDQHPAVSARELAVIKAGRPPAEPSDRVASASAWLALLKNRNMIFLSLSYFLDSYVMFIFVFWLFKYLMDVRKFSLIGGGWATSLPFVVASIMVPAFGYMSDRLSSRMGTLQGRRLTAMSCLVGAGMLLFVGASASTAWMALAAIALSVGLINSTEGPFWSTAIDLAGHNAGAAGGLMNMAGNFGGVACTTFVPLLVAWVGWQGALASGTILALVSAMFWLLIRPQAPRPGTGASCELPAQL